MVDISRDVEWFTLDVNNSILCFLFGKQKVQKVEEDLFHYGELLYWLKRCEQLVLVLV